MSSYGTAALIVELGDGSAEEVGDAEGTGVRFEADVRIRRAAVRDVLEAVARGQRQIVGEEVGETDARSSTKFGVERISITLRLEPPTPAVTSTSGTRAPELRK